MNIYKLKKKLEVKKFDKELKFESLFMEVSVSLLTGLFLIIWGLIIFSNNFYQFSYFTQLRNNLLTTNEVEEKLENINCIDIDPESILIFEDKNVPEVQYKLLAESIKSIRTYSEKNPGKRIVAGLDFAFLSKKDSTSYADLITEISVMPNNMFIVFGGIITDKSFSLKILRSDIYFDIYRKVISQNKNLKNQLFIGSIHYQKGRIVSGLNTEEEIKAAMGYSPIINNIYSLPLSMYIVGELLKDTNYKFATDFIDGHSIFGDKKIYDFVSNNQKESMKIVNKELHNTIGKDLNYFRAGFQFYNFFTGSDIKAFPKQYIPLSEISPSVNIMAMPLHEYKMYVKSSNTFNNTEYFFIARTKMSTVIAGDGQNDIILTPASNKNPLTNEKNTTSGVISHITALSNIIHNDGFIIDSSKITYILLILVAIMVFIISWNTNLVRSIFFNSLIIFIVITVSFILFLFNIFVPIKSIVSTAFIIYALITLYRFLISKNSMNLHKTAFNSIIVNKPKKLVSEKEFVSPSVTKKGITFIIFPKKLPTGNKDSINAVIYKQVYNEYVSIISSIIKKYNGNYDNLAGNGILAFWNIFQEEESVYKKNLYNSYTCAIKCMNSINSWQRSIDSLNNKDLSNFKATFDICLNIGDIYSGIVETDDRVNYIISGNSINESISILSPLLKDNINNVVLSKKFYTDILSLKKDHLELENDLRSFKKSLIKNETFLYKKFT